MSKNPKRFAVVQPSPHLDLIVTENGTPFLTIHTPTKRGGTTDKPWSGPDWDAARSRAGMVADALNASSDNAWNRRKA